MGHRAASHPLPHLKGLVIGVLAVQLRGGAFNHSPLKLCVSEIFQPILIQRTGLRNARKSDRLSDTSELTDRFALDDVRAVVDTPDGQRLPRLLVVLAQRKHTGDDGAAVQRSAHIQQVQAKFHRLIAGIGQLCQPVQISHAILPP